MSQTTIEKLLKGAEVEWKPIDEIAEIGTGSSNREDEKDGGQYPLYVRSKFILRSDNYEFDETAIIIPGEGGIGDIFHYVQGKYALHQRAYRIHLYSKDINSKFIYYFIFGNFKKYVSKKLVGSTSLSIRKPMLQNFLVPIPKLSVQKDIVRILDAFTAHTAELTSELTAELNERKKQYNYYRDKLLTFADDEVEWKPLGEVGELIRGNGLQKKDLIESGVPAIHYGQIYTYYGLYTEKTKSYVSSLLAKKLKKINCGDLVITNTSENIEDVLKPLVYLGNIPAVIGGHASIFKPRNYINGKYIAYLFNTNFFFKQKEKIARGTKVIEISLSDLSRIVLPIPSLERQKRIVSILDKFDALTTSISEGLPKEIELRNKQYEYYRDQLLNFPKPDLEN